MYLNHHLSVHISLFLRLMYAILDANVITCTPPAVGTICSMKGCNCSTSSQKLITVLCSKLDNQETKIDANSVPSEVLELVLVDSTGLISFEARSFSKLRFLQRIIIRNVKNLKIQKHAFLNLSSTNLLFDIFDCLHVQIETHSFFLTRGPVSVTIVQSNLVEINSASFSWIFNLRLIRIAELRLAENSFSQDPQKISRQGPTTKVTFSNVMISELPANSFPSSMLEIRLANSEIGTIRKDVFSALDFYLILLQNTAIKAIEFGAFSDRSLIQQLQFRGIEIEQLESGAIMSAVNNFTIADSHVQMIRKEALNMSAVVFVNCTNNVFQHIEERGLCFRNWNNVLIENNTFRRLESEAVYVITLFDDPSLSNKFLFSGNIFANVDGDCLTFSLSSLNISVPRCYVVNGNIFLKTCQCNLREWLRSIIRTSDVFLDAIYNTSYCSVNTALAHCFNLPEGFALMTGFSSLACHAREWNRCPLENKQQNEANALDATDRKKEVRSRNPNVEKAINILNERCSGNNRTVIVSLFAVALGGMLVMLIVSGVTWLNKNGRLDKLKTSLLPPANIVFTLGALFSRQSDFARTTSAHSITRISVHEYAELQLAKERKEPSSFLQVTNNNDERTDSVTVWYEDKATQTLPEELTHELLQSLREKLDDPNPDNYSEARTMIEHLYDLIKVEESCNNNTLSDVDLTEDVVEEDDQDIGNVYQTIGCPASATKRQVTLRGLESYRRNMVSTGTDVVLSNGYKSTSSHSEPANKDIVLITEYSEPADTTAYEYTEVESGLTSPFHDQCPSSSSFQNLVDGDLRTFASTLLSEYEILIKSSRPARGIIPSAVLEGPSPSAPDFFSNAENLLRPTEGSHSNNL